MKQHRTTLRQALVINLAPLLLFSVLIVGVTGAVLGGIEAESHALSSRLIAGDLGAGEIQGLALLVQLAWVIALAGFFLFMCVTMGLSVWVHRRVARRVERLVAVAGTGDAGLLADLPEVNGTGPLADLERALRRVGSNVRAHGEAIERESEISRTDAQLQRALDLADTEGDALDVVERALQQVVPLLPAEVLLADSSRAHLRRVAMKPDIAPPGCPVERPFQCAAVRRGQTLVFETSERLDACPKLRDHAGSPCSAVCTPLNVMGRTIGVLHVTAPEHQPPDRHAVRLFESIGTQAGARLGMIRTLATTQLQAQTDPLTGLMNRRSFEDDAAALIKAGPADVHSLVMCDLDHFKKLNDTAGHEAGDRALELFADTMRCALRPADLIGRYGGEEFVIFLPECNEVEATAAMERLRARLASACALYKGPRFTASFGVSVFARDGRDLTGLVRRADEALYAAKRRGRDRVVCVSEITAADSEVLGLGETPSRRLAAVLGNPS